MLWRFCQVSPDTVKKYNLWSHISPVERHKSFSLPNPYKTSKNAPATNFEPLSTSSERNLYRIAAKSGKVVSISTHQPFRFGSYRDFSLYCIEIIPDWNKKIPFRFAQILWGWGEAEGAKPPCWNKIIPLTKSTKKNMKYLFHQSARNCVYINSV